MRLNSPLRILHLEDNPFDAELVEEKLRSFGLAHVTRCVRTAEAFEEALKTEQFDLALCDYNVPGFNGFRALTRLRTTFPDVPIILLSGTLGEEDAVECLKQGATDYILKDRLHRLGPAIERALTESELLRDRKAAYERLRLNEERLSCVLMATNDAVYDLNLLTDKIWWNQGLELLFGYDSRKVATDLKWWECAVHPEDRVPVIRSLVRALASSVNSWSEEYRFLCADGAYANVYDRGYILRDENGKAVRLVGAMMDITEKRRMEEEIFRAQRMDTLGSIAGGVAHDLNNMLTPILASTEMLAESAGGGESKTLVDIIKSSALRGTELVRQILLFARGEGDLKVAIDLREFGTDLARLLKASMPKNIRLELQVAPGTPAVHANRTQLHQVLLNLCVNARDAMPKGGQIRITIGAEEQGKAGERWVVVRVTDTGTGIEAENLSRIFSPFYSTKKASMGGANIGAGTGLGLTTVRSIVDGHGGHVTVESTPGKGTTFSVYLPAAMSAVEEVQRNGVAKVEIRGNGEAVLVVENEVSMAQLIRTALETHHYEVVAAADAEDAARIVQREGRRFKVAIVGSEIGGMSGLALIQMMKRQYAGLSTIYVEAEKGEVAGTWRNVDRVLKRPFSARSLLEAVAQVLSDSKGMAAA
jgi:two-component system cell cycle sensor histidine kinase/response regulator CckA